MAKNYNKWIFEGNLLRDPEMRYTPGGHPVTTILVACNNSYKTGEGENAQKVEELVVYKATAWNSLAEVTSKFLRKGSHVLIEAAPVAEQRGDKPRIGRPKIWNDKDDHPHADFECKVLELRMLGNPRTEDQPAAPAENIVEEPVPAGDDPEFNF
jgi:single-stranded DNA-binding protein